MNIIWMNIRKAKNLWVFSVQFFFFYRNQISAQCIAAAVEIVVFVISCTEQYNTSEPVVLYTPTLFTLIIIIVVHCYCNVTLLPLPTDHSIVIIKQYLVSNNNKN